MGRRLLAGFGDGGATVDTVLDMAGVAPGERVGGRVHLSGGSGYARFVDAIAVALVARSDLEDHDDARVHEVFLRVPVAGRRSLPADRPLTLPFAFPLPWETPLTAAGGRALPGTTVGLSTHVHLANAVDATDLDPLYVEPHPAQAEILRALDRLGFRARHAGLRAGRLPGGAQTLPFRQELAFTPGRRWSAAMRELELTFVTGPATTKVVLDVDRRGDDQQPPAGRLDVDHGDVEAVDWPGRLGAAIDAVCARHGLAGFGAQHAGRYAGEHFDRHGDDYGQAFGTHDYDGNYGHYGRRGDQGNDTPRAHGGDQAGG